jgi:hypothetical protein
MQASEVPSERGRWWEDPHFGLDTLSAGQRYTAVIVGALAVAMLAIGVPRGGSIEAPTYVLPRGSSQSAGLTPPAPPTPAQVVASAPAPSYSPTPDVSPLGEGASYEPPLVESNPPPAAAPAPEPGSPPPAAPPPAAPSPLPALPVPIPGLAP